VRARLDAEIGKPLDPDELKEYEREHFGTSPEELAARESTDAAFAGNTFEPL
jgi:hypothetical protein